MFIRPDVAFRAWSLACLFVASLGLTGCIRSEQSNSVATKASGPAAVAQSNPVAPDMPSEVQPDSEAATAAAAASVLVVDADEYAARLKTLTGKVVLVDFWATWCGPCKEQFPHSNQLAKSLARRGLAVVSVSFDDPDNQDAVVKFLQEHPGPMTHLLSTYGAGVESFDNFAIEGGAVPFYKLYDRTGALRYQFCGDPEGVKGVIKVEELDDKIAELLGEAAP